MNCHYVYKITNNKPSDERKFYIGVRTSKNCSSEEDIEYWSSSKSLLIDIKIIGKEFFSKEVLKEFKTREEAINYEIKLHNDYEVSTNEEFYNRAKQKSNGFDRSGVKCTEEQKRGISERSKKMMRENPKIREMFTNNNGENNPFYGKSHSEETRRKIGEASRRRVTTKETKEKISKATAGANNPRAYTVLIYDSEGKLQETHKGTFHSLNGHKGYPYSAFIKSYKNNGKKIYQTNHGKSRAKYFGLEKYVGWYAKQHVE